MSRSGSPTGQLDDRREETAPGGMDISVLEGEVLNGGENVESRCGGNGPRADCSVIRKRNVRASQPRAQRGPAATEREGLPWRSVLFMTADRPQGRRTSAAVAVRDVSI